MATASHSAAAWPAAAASLDAANAVHRGRPQQIAGAVGVGLFLCWIAYQLVTNTAFRWHVVGEYIFSAPVLAGVQMTLFLTFLTLLLGSLLGIALAVMRLSRNPILNMSASAYVWFFRGVPSLVQLIFWFNFASLFPTIELGIPFGGPKLLSIATNDAVTPLVAALLGLGLVEAAYMGEIIRGGILSVDAGQVDASRALGMKPFYRLRRIILPQAMRSIIPSASNQFISLLKWTALASVVSLGELLLATQTIYNRNFQVIPLLTVAALWYLLLTSIFTLVQMRIEAYFSRGHRR
ncbi:MAG: amino acid ABC transporter permease [Chelatococcus sp.]|uniref:amino acid ABC transporter permease n=1 Tax=Chelatococcus sp. TaxID=1953771 RepID=UPI0025C36F7B|nr:amino acid ABC transporter permease [Chelatococcus sp.]MBX3540785.1 amino acid ABC transporter permease [Chelatococcus sp.]